MSDRAPDDDADTPRDDRYPRARSQSGEIEIAADPPIRRDSTGARTKYRQPIAERDGGNFRDFRKTGPIERVDAVPEQRGEEPTPPLPIVSSVELQEALEALDKRFRHHYGRAVGAASKAADHALEAVQRTPVDSKKWWHHIPVGALIISVLGGAGGIVWGAYRDAGARESELHDSVLLLQEQVKEIKATVDAVIVPRVAWPPFRSATPGSVPGKDPQP